MTERVEPIMLDHRVDLYIPSQCICTGSLPEGVRTGVIEEVKHNFDNWFGGHAEIPIKGDWRLPDGTIAKEEVVDIYSFCTGEALERHLDDAQRARMSGEGVRGTQVPEPDGLHCGPASLWQSTVSDDGNLGP
jgi:hypothetical protein